MIYFTSVHDTAVGSNFDATVRSRNADSGAPIWGITELSFSTFSRIGPGDFVMFYHKGMIVGLGRVSATTVDKDLSAKLWGTYQHKYKGTLHWSGIILFSEYHDLAMPFKEVIDLGAYEPKFSVRRIIQLNEVGCSSIQRLYGSEEEYVAHTLSSFGANQSANLTKA